MDKRLFGSGASPWHAVRDIARKMHAGRDHPDSVAHARGEIGMRVMYVQTRLNAGGEWIAEASWQVR